MVTSLTDMQNTYSSFFIRKKFTVSSQTIEPSS